MLHRIKTPETFEGQKPEVFDAVVRIGPATATAIENLRRLRCRLGYDVDTKTGDKRWWVITPNGRKLLSEPNAEMHYFFRVMFARIKRKWNLEVPTKPAVVVLN